MHYKMLQHPDYSLKWYVLRAAAVRVLLVFVRLSC